MAAQEITPNANEAGASKPIARPEEIAKVTAFAEAILHGDEEHRRWLLEAAKAFNAGEPLPPSHGLDAVAVERERCAGIVQLAREGELDSDFRSIISIIKYGDSLEQIQARD